MLRIKRLIGKGYMRKQKSVLFCTSVKPLIYKELEFFINLVIRSTLTCSLDERGLVLDVDVVGGDDVGHGDVLQLEIERIF
jgi:hypothetical protein